MFGGWAEVVLIGFGLLLGKDAGIPLAGGEGWAVVEGGGAAMGAFEAGCDAGIDVVGRGLSFGLNGGRNGSRWRNGAGKG